MKPVPSHQAITDTDTDTGSVIHSLTNQLRTEVQGTYTNLPAPSLRGTHGLLHGLQVYWFYSPAL